jgi:hypothetical protein
MGQNDGDWQKDETQQSCLRAMSGDRLLDLTTMQIHTRKELLLVYSSYMGSRISNKEVYMFIKDGILPEHKEHQCKVQSP